MSQKIQEAHEYCRAAEKCLQTNLFRWKPDYATAADLYSQAGQTFREARDFANAKIAYLKASDNYKMNKSLFHAAKAMETALIVYKENASADEIYFLASGAATLYQEYGSGDSAAGVLDKGGKLLQDGSPELALKLFQQAADASSSASCEHQAGEYISKASRLLVRMKRYDQALDSIRQEIEFHLQFGNNGAVGRLVVALILVQLARGDPIAGEKSYKEWRRYCDTPEIQTLDMLIQAYDDEDPEAAKMALASPFIKNMDVDYARLANTVPLPEVVELKPSSRAAPQEKSPCSTEPDDVQARTSIPIPEKPQADCEELC